MCKNLLVMVQKEVAQKFAAQPSEKVFGALSVITQSVGVASIVIEVPPSAFDPMPKVDSAVLLIQKKSSRNSAEFEQMLKVAFTQPRKTLMKNLSAHYDKATLQEAFSTLGLSLTIRPHQVSTTDYHQLYTMI
jgi:16S rRNA (adenine1518-N6/adenine1519-N6)-dimethyltransferase